MKKNNDQTSLSMYTALIFLVAIVMIVVSFFAQTHLEQSMVNDEHEAEKVSLSNKAAQVSEENMQLIELNKSLREKNTKLEEDNALLSGEKDMLLKEIAGYEALISVYDALSDGKEKAAEEMLLGIFTEDLTPAQKDFYDTLVEKIQ